MMMCWLLEQSRSSQEENEKCREIEEHKAVGVDVLLSTWPCLTDGGVDQEWKERRVTELGKNVPNPDSIVPAQLVDDAAARRLNLRTEAATDAMKRRYWKRSDLICRG